MISFVALRVYSLITNVYVYYKYNYYLMYWKKNYYSMSFSWIDQQQKKPHVIPIQKKIFSDV